MQVKPSAFSLEQNGFDQKVGFSCDPLLKKFSGHALSHGVVEAGLNAFF